MDFIVRTTPEELLRARQWWTDLEGQWKMAYNEAVFGRGGPTLEPPHDDHLMLLLIQVDTLRFAGPGSIHPNVSVSLTNLSGLIPLYHLTYLSLTGHAVTGVRELRRFTKLRSLFINDNKITSLEGIEAAVGLENLYVQHNRITSLRPVSQMTNLHTLYAANNHLKSLEGLTKRHGDKMRRCHILPNDDLPDREIIRLQNEIGLLARQG